MIPQRTISLIANAPAASGGRRIPEAVIERDYVLAWFLTGLAGHPLREALAFKGGTALRRRWFDGYRFSEDLDFTLTRPTPFDAIQAEPC
jgi:predicted nucleotidyltransferase component of viral defense system